MGSIIISGSNAISSIIKVEPNKSYKITITGEHDRFRLSKHNIEGTEIVEAIKRLPKRERELIEYKFFKEKKLREISEEFDISQSRISRIIQSGLDKVKKDLKKRGVI